MARLVLLWAEIFFLEDYAAARHTLSIALRDQPYGLARSRLLSCTRPLAELFPGTRYRSFSCRRTSCGERGSSTRPSAPSVARTISRQSCARCRYADELRQLLMLQKTLRDALLLLYSS
jgi:hypothetical protein